jgi:hypothetical protein
MKTKDLNFSAFLLAHGQKLKGAEPDSYGRFYFEFDDSAVLAKLSDDFYLHDALVNAQVFSINQKKLKSLVRNFNPFKIQNDNSTIYPQSN